MAQRPAPPSAIRTLKMAEHLPGHAGSLPLSVRWHDVNQMVGAHDHDFYELVLVTHGRGEHYTSRRRVLTTAGDVWAIRPGHWHTYMNAKHLGVFNCLIGTSLFKELAPGLQRAPGSVELFWRGPAKQARDGCCLLRLDPARRLEAERILERLAEILSRGDAAAELEARGELWAFLAILSRAAEAELLDAKSMKARSDAKAPRHDAAVAALELLETRFAEPLAVEELAAAAGVSAPHLTRLFRRLTGRSPMQYLNDVRIQRACTRLAESDESITSIAGAVGWPDPNLFARRFRQALGVSPRAYRAEKRGSGR
ncbi:MAG: helix-turn-helix transcriptional regulator [Planctomycetes bacterium]|nr:helix-turn-helix transcriptional regulator [Planctomycetota bacterium]